LAAVRHNAALLAGRADPASLCAVVKANAYGHGPVPVAHAALEGGAAWLAVALVEEGAALRDGGIRAPVLLLSEPPLDAMADVVALGLTPTVYTREGVAALAEAGARRGRRQAFPVHVKVDTGMRRVGATADDAVKLALAVEEHPHLRLEGVWTHFAVADVPGDGEAFTLAQHARLGEVLEELAGTGIRPSLVHACNSAGTLAHAQCHDDLVRCGIALYGVAPSRAMEGMADLRPALSLRARVSYVKEVEPGEGISYGLRYRPERRSVIATVPIGYADGVPWRLGVAGGEVLVGGRRRRIAGAVTMDQILVDCGDDRTVTAGDEVVLLGSQGDERIGAWEWAERVGTIAYEVLCGIGPRVPRVYDDGSGGGVKQPASLPR
jgi:alanine racemase